MPKASAHKKLFRVEETRSDIEACDLFSKSKQFIHVKFKTRSSLLSHLFAQAYIKSGGGPNDWRTLAGTSQRR